MKEIRTLFSSLLVCGVAVATVSTVSAQTPTEEVAKVVRIVGAARYAPPGGTMQDLKVGTLLQPGSVIQSGMDKGCVVNVVIGSGTGPLPSFGSVDFRRLNATSRYTARTTQSIIRLYGDTALGVDKLAATETGAGRVTSTQLDLRKGHIMGNVKKLSAGSEFLIKYPKGVAGIRGTVFDMTVERLRELKENEKPEDVPVSASLSMGSGSGVISYGEPGQPPVTVTVNPMQSWHSGMPSAGPIDPGLLTLLNVFTRDTTLTTIIGGGLERLYPPDNTVFSQIEPRRTAGPRAASPCDKRRQRLRSSRLLFKPGQPCAALVFLFFLAA